LASDALVTTLHPLLENVLQTVRRKLQQDSGTGAFDLRAPFSWLEKPRNGMGRDLDCMADVLMVFH
jgi:cell division FtsZ-interacting protein ZapD